MKKLIIYDQSESKGQKVYECFRKIFPNELWRLFKLNKDVSHIVNVSSENDFRPWFEENKSVLTDIKRNFIGIDKIYLVLQKGIHSDYITDYINKLSNVEVVRITPKNITVKSLKKALESTKPVNKRNITAYKFQQLIDYVIRNKTYDWINSTIKLKDKLSLYEYAVLNSITIYEERIRNFEQQKLMYIDVKLANGMTLRAGPYNDPKEAKKSWDNTNKKNKIVIKKHKKILSPPDSPTLLELIHNDLFVGIPIELKFAYINSLFGQGLIKYNNENRIIPTKLDREVEFDNNDKGAIYDHVRDMKLASKSSKAVLDEVCIYYGMAIGFNDVIKEEGWLEYAMYKKSYKKKLNIVSIKKVIEYTEYERLSDSSLVCYLETIGFKDISKVIRTITSLKQKGFIHVEPYNGNVYPSPMTMTICNLFRTRLEGVLSRETHLQIETEIEDIKKTGKIKLDTVKHIWNLFQKAPLINNDELFITGSYRGIYIKLGEESFNVDASTGTIKASIPYTCFRKCPTCNRYRKVTTMIRNKTPQKVVCKKCGKEFNY